ncbi:MAG: six-cysteine ranthipeptide SCIFF [Peptococcaceae bacterium]|nr:six-cysteine ranthipeptide SCIFF [Peptococcaceae bacterium]
MPQRLRVSKKSPESQHIQTVIRGTLNKIDAQDGCGQCQTSCQSACKTSCTVGNQVCEKSWRL